MKTKPLMICEKCGHKPSEHAEGGCKHGIGVGIALTGVVVCVIVVIGFAVGLTAFPLAASMVFFGLVVGDIFNVCLTCDCPEKIEHKHEYVCKCGEKR